MGKRITYDDGSVTVAGKRGNGEGSITKHSTKAGIRWQMTIYDERGKRVFSYFKTEGEAKAALEEAQKAKDAGRPVKPERHTLGELLDAWLDSLKAQVERGERAFNTWREYECYVRQHVKPVLGSTDCRRLSVKDVEDFFATLQLAPKTRHNIRIALRRALNVGLR